MEKQRSILAKNKFEFDHAATFDFAYPFEIADFRMLIFANVPLDCILDRFARILYDKSKQRNSP